MSEPASRPIQFGSAAAASVEFDGGRLRPWSHADAPRLVQAWSDPDIARWNAVPPDPTAAYAEQWISRQQDRLDRQLAVDLVIDTGHANGIVGEVGLSSFDTRRRAALIGYWLLPEARGHGTAASAVQTFSTWAHEAIQLDVIVARCHQDNARSQEVVARAGYERATNDDSGNQLWLSRPREK